jgi:hypothetical protein
MVRRVKTISAVIAVAILSGCAATGSALDQIANSVALAHDRADPCQAGTGNEARRLELGRPEGYQRPTYCFTSQRQVRVRTDLYNTQGQRVGSATTTIK